MLNDTPRIPLVVPEAFGTGLVEGHDVLKPEPLADQERRDSFAAARVVV